MLLSVVPTLRQAPLQALARVHAVAAGASLPEDRLGRPRDPESAQRLRGVADLLTARTSAPALLVAAVVHAELATAAPFASHNGIVARAAERLVLVARGVDEKSLVVPEAGHLALRAAYESNLRGYADGGRAGRARLGAVRRGGVRRGRRGEPAAPGRRVDRAAGRPRAVRVPGPDEQVALGSREDRTPLLTRGPLG